MGTRSRVRRAPEARTPEGRWSDELRQFISYHAGCDGTVWPTAARSDAWGSLDITSVNRSFRACAVCDTVCLPVLFAFQCCKCLALRCPPAPPLPARLAGPMSDVDFRSAAGHTILY